MPDRRSYSFPATPAGPSGYSFLPPMASADPALSATQQGQETAPMVAQEAEEAPMQADGGSWYGHAAAIFAGFSAAFLALRSRLQSPAPQHQSLFEMAVSNPSPSPSRGAEPVYSASSEVRGALQGPIVAHMQSSQDRFAYKTSCGYDIQAPYWAENGGIFGWPDLIWAREAEVKHGRIAMLAATGLIAQDLPIFPFPFGKWAGTNWYDGEKVWALHDKAVEVGSLKQVLFLLFLFEVPFIQKALSGELDGTGNLDFDPLGLKSDRRAVVEIKNGRLAMIAFGGMMQHYLITGKGPVQFITQIPNFKSCVATASQLPGAKVASQSMFGNTLAVADALCR